MKFLTAFIILFFLILSNANLQAQWTQVDGIYASNITALAISGNNIYAGTNYGFYLSTNNGTNWTAKTNGIGFARITSISISGNNIYAGTGNNAYKSTDNGTSWVSLSIPLPNNNSVYSLASNGNSIYAGGYHGLFRSTDNGLTWASAGLPNITVYSLAVKGDTIFAGCYWDSQTSSFNSLFLSTDNGITWFGGSGSSSNYFLKTIAVNGNNVFVGSFGVFLSTDNGLHFSPANNGLPTPSCNVNSITINGNKIFAGTDSGLFLSSDNGTNWINITNGKIPEQLNAVTIKGDTIFTGSTFGGVYSSTDDGMTWEQNSRGLGFTEVNSFSVSGDSLFACTRGTGVNVLLNKGSICSQLYKGLQGQIFSFAADGNNFFAGAGYGICRSTNRGADWFYAQNNGYAKSLAIKGNSIMAGVQDSGLYISRDNGSSWTLTGPHNGNYSLLVKDNKIFSAGLGIYVSTNDGTDWFKLNNQFSSIAVLSIVTDGINLFAGTNGNGVYLSTNNGDNWVPVNNGLNNLTVGFMTAKEGLVCASTQDGVYISQNSGTTWSKLNNGLPVSTNQPVAICEDNLFVATNSNGVWSCPLEELTSVTKEESDLPKNFSLFQNYPNPFNPNTTVTYSLPASSNVKLIIYNALGQTIKILDNGYKQAGNYSVNFNASDLPSSIYFYKLEAGQFSQIKKMILLK